MKKIMLMLMIVAGTLAASAQIVKNKTDLRAYYGRANVTLMLCAENMAVYEFQTASTTADDGDSIIRPKMTNAGRWVKLTGVGEFTRMTLSSVTTDNASADSITVSKFIKLVKATKPDSTIGKMYFSSVDSSIYYFTGRTWKKIKTE